MAMAALGRRLRRNGVDGSLLALLPAAQTPPCATFDSLIGFFAESDVQANSYMPQPSRNNSWQPLFALSGSIFSVSSSFNCPWCRPLDPGAAIWPSLGSTELRVSGANNVVYRGFAKAKKSRGEDVIEVSIGTGSPEQAREIASSQMEVAMDVLIVELSKLRTGRASLGMLDHVMVEVHGTKTPLNNVAAVSVFDSQTINVFPFDSSMVKEVERAICSSPLRLTPISEGQTVKVPIPRLTKEHCQTMCKLVSKAGEAAKLSLRRGRQNAMDHLKKLSKIISKDELKRYEKEIEELTKKHVKSVEDICKKKEQEILTG